MSDKPDNAAAERTRSRNTELGDRACFCSECGWARRFYPGVVEPPSDCPSCSARVVSACAQCGADILSVMAVQCDECEAQLRAPDVSGGVRIRRSPRLPLTPPT